MMSAVTTSARRSSWSTTTGCSARACAPSSGTGYSIVGEAEDVDSAVAVILATQPEVVLLDVHLPGGNGPR